MADTATNVENNQEGGESRRDFLLLATSALGAAGVGAAVWPFVHSMNPSADVLALASTEVDLSPIEEGQSITIIWRGKPVFVRHRTSGEIEQAKADDSAELIHAETDGDRVQQDKWLVCLGVCTHLGCVPLGQKPGDPRGEFGGWFCPCHGSHYDTSGRIRKGPAPLNLPIPPYNFVDDENILIG